MSTLDEFVARFTDLDLRARQARSANEYRARYLRALRAPTAPERARIARAFRPHELDALLRARQLVLPPASAWPPVRVLVSADRRVEGNMPHTMVLRPGAPPVIVIPAGDFAAPDFDAVLSHEYVHLLQRAFPTRFADWYRRHWQLVPAEPAAPLAARCRANPDAPPAFARLPDGRGGPGASYATVYSELPSRLTDVATIEVTGVGAVAGANGRQTVRSDLDHPHELFAEAIEAETITLMRRGPIR
jgi:hypothetical protein